MTILHKPRFLINFSKVLRPIVLLSVPKSKRHYFTNLSPTSGWVFDVGLEIHSIIHTLVFVPYFIKKSGTSGSTNQQTKILFISPIYMPCLVVLPEFYPLRDLLVILLSPRVEGQILCLRFPHSHVYCVVTDGVIH